MKNLKRIYKKAKIKSIALNFLLIFIVLFNNVYYIFAQEIFAQEAIVQEASGSAAISPTETPQDTPSPASPFEEPTPTFTPIPTPEPQSVTPTSPDTSPTLAPAINSGLLTSPAPRLSAEIRTPIKSYLISNSHLTGSQSLEVGLLNAKGVDLKVGLFREAEEVDIGIREKFVGDTVVLIVDPPVSFIPGKYTVRITDPLNHTEEQTFFWGVLALNFNKSVYSPKDQAKLGMTVLDEQGKKICDTKLNLKITNDQFNINDELSTDNGKIKATPQCGQNYTSNEPDYVSTYEVGEAGIYNLNLTATAKNGTYNFADSLEVKNDISFTVDRQDFPTRLNPSREIEVGFKITTNQDFSGTVVEVVPENFYVASSSATPYNWLATGVAMPDGLLTGADSPSIIRYPFEGDYPVTLKFGENVVDDKEQLLYEQFKLKGHDGIDFALPEGTPVLAVDDGTAILAGAGAYGVTVVLQHNWGRSYYGHLSGTGLNLGDKVLKGAKIGLSGRTGLATGPHLHFGMKFTKNDMKNGYYGKVDPWPYLTGSSIKPEFAVRLIGWNVDLKKGEIKELRYRFDAPDMSSQFYLLGPLRFYEKSVESEVNKDSPFVLGVSTEMNTKPLFMENRQWQMAVDAVEPPAQSQAEALGKQAETRRAERSVIHKGKPVNTNLKENSKAVARSRGERVAGVADDEKLFRWEVELPHGTTFGFGEQEVGAIRPVVKIRNRDGWFVEFSPISADNTLINAEGNPTSTDYVKPKVNGNQIEWEISPGITARYTALKDRIKADYIVKDKESLGSGRLDFKVEYNDEYSGDFGEELINGKGYLTPVLTPDGQIDWLGENNLTYFTFPKPSVKDSVQSALDANFEIKKTGKGTSILSINLDNDQLQSAKYPITIDPTVVDSTNVAASATRYGNGRKLVRDGYGNLIAFINDYSDINNDVFYKNYNAASWTDAAIDLTVTEESEIAADIDSNNDIHLVGTQPSADDEIFYMKLDLAYTASNTISSISIVTGTPFEIENNGEDDKPKPSLIVANKGEGAGKEKVAVAWSVDTASGGTKRGEIRFMQCDVSDGCDAASEWKNASEEKNGNGTCSDTATSGDSGIPGGFACKGASDALFAYTAGHTIHHQVLTQVPGRPARTPASAKFFDNGTSSYTDLTGALDDDTGTNTGTTLNSWNESTDFLYIGDDNLFSRIVVDMVNTNTAANLNTLAYCSSNSDENTTCDTWTNVSNMIDNTTTAFDEDGSILFDEPSNWVKSTENSVKKYWIRISNGGLDLSVSIAEIEVTDRNSKALLITGGNNDDFDLRAAYVVWDDVAGDKWENNPGTAGNGWRVDAAGSSSAFSDTGANWATYTNFPLTSAVDYINNGVYIAYVFDTTTDQLTVKKITNNLSLTVAANWTNTSLPDVTEAGDIALSLTSDAQSGDIYLFYVLDPDTNGLVFRKCVNLCDGVSDWNAGGGEKTLSAFVSTSEEPGNPQAVVSKANGDSIAIDVIYTNLLATPTVEYERHFVDMADKTIVVAESADDAAQIDCDDGSNNAQYITLTYVRIGHNNANANCSGSGPAKVHGGLRFPSVNISQGAAISSAYIDLRNESGSGTVDFTIYGYDTDNAPVFDTTNLIENLTKTTTSYSFSTAFSTNSTRLDVTRVVQEIICRGAGSSQPCVGNYNGSGNWASGNAIAILLISTETSGGDTADFTAFDTTGTVMLDPTLQINLGNSSKRYSIEVDKDATNSNDLDHPMETEEFTAVNTDDSLTALVSASLVPSASSSAVPIFQFKVNNSNNNNTDDLSATAIVKTSIPSKSYGGLHYAGRAIYLQLYDTTNGWQTKDIEAASAADTDITLSSGTVTGSSNYYRTESPGGTCSGSDCWAAWRIYQDAAPEANQILYVDNFTYSFTASGPTNDQLLHHGAWFSAAGVEQPFTF